MWGGGDSTGVPAFVYIILAFLLVGIIIGCLVCRRYYLRYMGKAPLGGGVHLAKVSPQERAGEGEAAAEIGPSRVAPALSQSGRPRSPLPDGDSVRVYSAPGEVERTSRGQSSLRATGDASNQERRASERVAYHEQRAEQLQRQIVSVKEQARSSSKERTGSKQRHSEPGALYGTRTSWDGTPAHGGGARRPSFGSGAAGSTAPKFDFGADTPEVARLKKQVAEELTSSSGEEIDVRRKNFRMLCLRWHSSRNKGEDSRKAEDVYKFLMQQRDWYLSSWL